MDVIRKLFKRDRPATRQEVLESRDRIVREAARAFSESRVSAASESLRQLSSATIDDETLARTDAFLPQIAAGRRLVATLDPTRRAGADEVVILYGNYPRTFANVVVNNPIKRHVSEFWRFRHDEVEYDPRWRRVDQILIINKDSRVDRLDAVLRELATARAPFDRVVRIPACIPEPNWEWKGKKVPQGGLETLACLRSHIRALETAREANADNVLVLEDDFCFTSDLDEHLNDLETFFERKYDYWVCLTAASKYGSVVPVDDLVATSFQACTNAAGYLVSREGLTRVLDVFEDAATQLVRTGEVLRYAADRCWAVLQPSGKFLVFNRKHGFQVSSFSDIEGKVARYLD